MNFTPYHAKYFAFELTKRLPANDVGKLAASLQDAQVDLNPHQVEAALFAFESPLSKGALLADEVGLGKTIEAGLILSQKWAERKRKLLIIAPSNLRKQWSQELADKFFLSTYILESQSFNAELKAGNLNPFVQQNNIVICSYQFARSKEAYIRAVHWDLAIIDEAHRLRNVYKSSNKIGRSIKDSLARTRKVLLTATPLQNSLLELYGLISIVDDHIFGDLKSFKSQFSKLVDEENFDNLKERLKPICKRTLRRQVIEYINYTNRIAIVEEFIPSQEEQELYNLVSDYLRRKNLFALPAGQRQLMTLILRKLLASSTYAISGTLEGLGAKLDIEGVTTCRKRE
jgi:SNF2 family DNA or RNA helicase